MKYLTLLLLTVLSATAQLEITNETITVSSVPTLDTTMAWILRDGSWNHYATNSTGSYIDGVAAGWDFNPFVFDGTNVVIGAETGTFDKVSGYQGYDINGLVGYWSMDNVSGTTLSDDFGSFDLSNEVGTPEYATAYGVNNDGIFVDGSEYVYENTSAFETTSTVGSISYWVKPSDLTFNGFVFASCNDGGTAWYFSVGVNQGRPSITQRNDDLGDTVVSDFVCSTSEFTHIVWVSNGTSYKAYINGVEETNYTVISGSNSGDWFGDTSTRNNIAIGTLLRSSPVAYFDGSLDEIAIYNRALSSNEAATIYNDNVGKFLSDQVTSNQLAHYILDTAWDYDATLAHDTNLLARAEYWDYTAGNEDVLFALDLENLGVASGQEVQTNVIRDVSFNANDGIGDW